MNFESGGGTERVTSVIANIKRQRETILFLKRYRYMKCHNERIVQ